MACVRKRRGKWVVDFRDQTGARRWRTFDTRKAAEDAMTELRKQVKDGVFIDAAKLPTFAEVATRWLDGKRDHPHSTWDFWRGHVENHLLPAFGPLRVDHVTSQAVEAFRNQKRDGCDTATVWRRGDDGEGRLVWYAVENAPIQKLARGTVNQILQTLAAVLEYAVDHRYLLANPAKRVKRVRMERRAGAAEVLAVDPKEVLTAEQAGAVIEAADAGLYRTFIKTALLTGARSGELLALDWSRIDLEAARLRIDRSLSWQRGVEKGYGKSKAVFGPTKTPSSVRTLDLAADLVRELKAWKLRTPYSQETDLVFATSLGGPLHRAFLHKGLRKALDQCPGVPRVDLHGLRHSFASLMIQIGRPVTEVSKLLGHKDAQLTLKVYAHWFEGASSAGAMAQLAGAIGGDGSKTVAASAGTKASARK